jgi:uncharacterized DUF497 family protein
VRFEWDDNKNRTNQQKHGVSFERAARVFCDRGHILEPNRWAGAEERLNAIGMADGILLYVVYTERTTDDDEETIRIISARKASLKERSRYTGLH